LEKEFALARVDTIKAELDEIERNVEEATA